MSWDNREKALGSSEGGWKYDEVNLTYDAVVDLDSGLKVYYDGLGSKSNWTNLQES